MASSFFPVPVPVPVPGIPFLRLHYACGVASSEKSQAEGIIIMVNTAVS